ncbi:MAG: hypothetical protein ACRCTL_11130 [Pseudomonas sp.]
MEVRLPDLPLNAAMEKQRLFSHAADARAAGRKFVCGVGDFASLS